MSLPSVTPLAGLGDPLLATLRARLVAAGYDASTIGAAERIAPGQFDRIRLPVVQWRLAQDPKPAALLARLFAYTDAISEPALRTVLGDEVVAALAEAGVLVIGTDGVRCAYRLMPFEGLYLLSDDLGLAGDTVMGPGPTTVQLALTMPRVPGRVLDVGCGAGTFALLAAARGATTAFGVDISERAVLVSRFNARLNALRAEFRAGDLLAPVAGMEFDLVLAQPPYVLHPPDVEATTYLHGGAAGDELACRLAGEVPSVVAPGGRAVLLFESFVRPGAPLQVRLRQALGTSAANLVVLAGPGLPPDAQAVAYASSDHPELDAAYAEAARRYIAHVDALGLREGSHAFVVIARDVRPGPPGGRYTLLLPIPNAARPDSAAIDDVLAALDLASSPEPALLAAKVLIPERARFVEERRRPDPEEVPRIFMRFEAGSLATDRDLSEATYVLLGLLEHAPTIADAVTDYATACQATAPEVQPQVITMVRDALVRGMLTTGRAS